MSSVSVIIPCFGRQEMLDACLKTLLNQTRKADEIIVVDDGSDLAIRVPDGVRYLRIEREPGYRGSSAAKNRGAKMATSEWLAFSDNDIIHLPDALESVMKVAEAGPENALYNVFSITIPEAIKFRDPEEIVYLMDHRTFDRLGTKGILSTEQHLGVIRKDYFNSLGGYDEEVFKNWGLNNQDLCLRIRNSGGLVSSNIYRNNGRLLHCFHPDDPPNDVYHVNAIRDAEFSSKWGKQYGGFRVHKTGT